ncbi:hypothetical protein ALC57_17618 [Trachymyrmex cornetzi]|uniref:Uncharacterized protein n=1 Tax=Trachymyrmex cornetzi TaxID=471704 RepID=A0A151ITA4_9HYME|nr:hypothetical protein ALC57_17618 [Trachymyrmex cornetzi]
MQHKCYLGIVFSLNQNSDLRFLPLGLGKLRPADRSSLAMSLTLPNYGKVALKFCYLEQIGVPKCGAQAKYVIFLWMFGNRLHDRTVDDDQVFRCCLHGPTLLDVPCLPNCTGAIERSCSRAGLFPIGRIYSTLTVVIIADGSGERHPIIVRHLENTSDFTLAAVRALITVKIETNTDDSTLNL